MSDHVVASVDELEEGDRIVVQVEGRPITVFNIEGEYYAYTNWCPHQGGPACEGKLTGTTGAEFDPETLEISLDWRDEGRILTCPWHAWEFDVTTGACRSRDRVRLVGHDVTERNGDIVVSL